MKTLVYYQSRTGNTKKVAEAIAEALGIQARSIEEEAPSEADLLFLGCGVYAASLDKQLKAFVERIKGKFIKRVVMFGTSAGGKKPFGMLKRCLKKNGILVAEQFLYIPGSWWVMNKGRPNQDDLEKAKAFAKEVATTYEK